ncbi:MAG: TolC family protein [Trueperaceae bacterium]|nr:TolC family protein [Trueperaceae bacterium]
MTDRTVTHRIAPDRIAPDRTALDRVVPRFLSLLLGLVLLVPMLAPARGQAPAEALDLATAMDRAVQASAEVRTARLDLDAAQREAARVEADPTSLRVPTLTARHDVEAARDALRNAESSARDAAADAFEAALEAQDSVAIAEVALRIARVEARAAEIRLEAGAATESDVARAQDVVRSAERDLRDAGQALELALDRLAVRLGAVGDLPTLEGADREPVVPDLDAATSRLDENASLRSSRRAVVVAQARLEAVDVAFTVARADIEAARDRLASARLRTDDLQSSLTLAVRQAHNAVLAAEGRLASAREQVATAEEDVRVASVRFEAGSIAEVALERARLDLLRRTAEARVARNGLADALRSLEATILGAGS